MGGSAVKRIAILYQAAVPPPIHGVIKPLKPGGYRDSGADIGYALTNVDFPLVTPVPCPDAGDEETWVFPDTACGIDRALQKGAEVLWANTTVYQGHPLEQYMDHVAIIGQDPHLVDRYEDKWLMNSWLASQGFLVPRAIRVKAGQDPALDDFADEVVVLKPVRGRGSQGVRKVQGQDQLHNEIRHWDLTLYGDALLIESYLPGEEVTVTVMPPGTYQETHGNTIRDGHWVLPPVMRSGHVHGIVPYSGVVPVRENSRVLDRWPLELDCFLRSCMDIGNQLNSRMVLRIDARADHLGQFRIVDVNFKPNLTGPGRPDRSRHTSLVTMAAEAMGWSYSQLVANLARQYWRRSE